MTPSPECMKVLTGALKFPGDNVSVRMLRADVHEVTGTGEQL